MICRSIIAQNQFCLGQIMVIHITEMAKMMQSTAPTNEEPFDVLELSGELD